MAALVGQHLGLPIPPIAAIDVDPLLANAILDEDSRAKFAGPQQCHFGSKLQYPGFETIPVGMHLPASLVEVAISVFAFDMLIQNPDRTNEVSRGKPNALCNGDRLVIFDHELAFSFLHQVGGDAVPLPWEMRRLGFARYHLFYDDLVRYVKAKKDISFDGFLRGVASLSDEVFNSMAGALPSEWMILDNLRKIVAYLTTARDNVSRLDQGLREVLV